MASREDIQQKIADLEARMSEADFWADKNKAQAAIKELQDLKNELEGAGKYDKGGAIMTIFSGAGGDDAEDFSRILLDMYRKYIEKRGWTVSVLSETPSEHGGYRNVSIEISGKNVYGDLKNESGVHRLVRMSPFSSKGLRHTSFSMVEVVPILEKASDFVIPESEIKVEFAKAGGPGGQNVNKRETAARAVHIPTNIAVLVATQRSQAQNKDKALEMLRGKLFKFKEEEKKKKEAGLYVSKTTDIEWGNQIRSYVFHPYQMIKDHRTDVEIRNIDSVLEGELDAFIEAEKKL